MRVPAWQTLLAQERIRARDVESKCDSRSSTPSHFGGGGSVQTYFCSLDDGEEAAPPPATPDKGPGKRPTARAWLPRTGVSSPAPSESRGLKRVRVAVRCRPGRPDDEQREAGTEATGGESCVRLEYARGAGQETKAFAGRVRVMAGASAGGNRSFKFDHVFGPEVQQRDVFETLARPIVRDVLEGFNGAILAYGQTGTGKTYTMGILDRVCEQREFGVIPGSLQQIFQDLEDAVCGGDCGCKSQVKISFLQIYLETLQDLLAPLDGGQVEDSLTMREDPREGFYVQGLRSFAVGSYAEALALVNLGLENRRMACTRMNASSSRSHTVLTVEVSVSPCAQNKAFLQDADLAAPTAVHGKLRLIDLAGSERVKASSSVGARVQEARSINVSLSALGNVVATLAQRDERDAGAMSSLSSVMSDSTVGTLSSGNSHVPFRDSKLTRLLQDTLAGKVGCNTALVATISPARTSLRETLSTLKFASRCMRVRSEATARREVNYADLCTSLQRKLAAVQQEFSARENALRAGYERELSALRLRPVGPSEVVHEMYSNFMALGADFRARLQQQRRSLEDFVRLEFQGTGATNESLKRVQHALRPFASPTPQSKLAQALARSLSIPVSSIDEAMLGTQVLPRDEPAPRLALHTKLTATRLRMEAEESHKLLRMLTDELISFHKEGAKREEDLAYCSQVLKYLLKTNSQLRSEMTNCGATAATQAAHSLGGAAAAAAAPAAPARLNNNQGRPAVSSALHHVPESAFVLRTAAAKSRSRVEAQPMSQLDRFLLEQA